MSFVTPPTFADGNVLSASQLNTLAANQNYLAGLASSVNPGFTEFNLGGSGDEVYISMIHAHDWLYVRTYHPSDDCSVKVYHSGDGFSAVIGELKWESTGGGEDALAIDLSGLAGLTKGAWVRYRLRGAQEGGVSDESTVRYFAETAEEVV